MTTTDIQFTPPEGMTPEQTQEWAASVRVLLDSLTGEMALAKLREPFTGDSVGKLPRITCGKCRNAQSKVCDDNRHNKAECNICGNWITSAHMHLDYVGHAEVTDRLLTVDPEWDWDFLLREVDPSMMALVDGASPDTKADMLAKVIANSPPLYDRNRDGQPIGLWIRLTIASMTRKGYGSVESGKFDAEKQLIGDAIRNAAMRFGVALALWNKGSLESEAVDDGRTPPTRSTGESPPSDPPADHGTGYPPPWWKEYGYQDEDEAKSVNDSLRDILDAVSVDHREPIRLWCMATGYTETGPDGELRAVPIPVRKSDVPAYRGLLVAARDKSQAGPGATAAGPQAPAAQETPPVAATADQPGEVAQLPPPTPPEPDMHIPAGVPAEELERMVAEVQAMKVPERKERLRELGLTVSGTADQLGARLTRAMATNWLARNAPAPPPAEG